MTAHGRRAPLEKLVSGMCSDLLSRNDVLTSAFDAVESYNKFHGSCARAILRRQNKGDLWRPAKVVTFGSPDLKSNEKDSHKKACCEIENNYFYNL